MPSLGWIGRQAVENYHKEVPFHLLRCNGKLSVGDADSKEKRDLGELWEARSGGKCLFIMPKGKDFAAIRTKIGHK